MVASCSINHKICLEKLYQSEHGQFSDFNPDTFPGLIYKMKKDPELCLLIFASGKIVITGGKNRADIDKGFNKISKQLWEIRKFEIHRK